MVYKKATKKVSPNNYRIRESLFPNKKRPTRDSTERYETYSIFGNQKWKL